MKAVPVGSDDTRPPPELKRGRYDDRIAEKRALWPQAKELHRWLKRQPDGAAHITITERYKVRFRAALSRVNLNFLKLKPQGKILESYVTRGNNWCQGT